MAGNSTGQAAPAQEAGRPQPQTTVEMAGGPFIRHSQPGRRQQYVSSGVAFGGIITQPLVATPGYLRSLRMLVAAGGGNGTGQTTTKGADAPFNTFGSVILRDAFGTPLIVAPGYEALKIIPKYAGQLGLHALSDPANLPSFSDVATGAGASGNFQFASVLPFEFAKAYGVISGANAALLPTLQLVVAGASTVYGSQVPNTTLPTLSVTLESDFYWLPEGVDIEPPGLGTTQQWTLQQCNPNIGSAATATVALPRLGGYLSSIILLLRDSTGARIDQYPTRIRLYVDGVPLTDSLQTTVIDDMQIAFAGVGSGTGNSQWQRDTGVMAFTRKNSLGQESSGLLDTGEAYLSTNPGTLIQVEGAPWGTISNAPATLNALVGQVVPAGSLIQGLPEL